MRRGIVTIELIVAAGLLTVLLALMVQMLTRASAERQRLERRAIALQEVTNLLEQAAALSWDQLMPGELKQITISAEVARLLPEASAQLQVADEPGKLAARKLTAQIRWKPEPGRPEPAVGLVTWVYPVAGQPPAGAQP